MAHSTLTTLTSSIPESSSLPATSLTTALLTRFTPPADCKTTLAEWGFATSQAAGAIVTAQIDVGPRSCRLQTFALSDGQYTPLVYSPGVCRAGYTPASTISIGLFGEATTSLCCLKGLTILSMGRGKGNCGSTITSPGVTIVQGTQGGITTSTVVDSFFLIDLPYTVAWASSELPLFTPSGLPLIVANESRPESSTRSDDASVPAKGATGSSYLSAGAQAGIGVGAAVAGITIGACFMWFFFIRKRSRRRQEGKGKNLDDGPGTPELGAEGGISEVAAKEKAFEMYADVGHEFPQDWGQEVDAGMRHELDANYKGEELTDTSTPVDGDSPTWTEVIEKLRPIHHYD